MDDLIVGAPTEDGAAAQGTVSVIFGGSDLPASIGPSEVELYGTVIEGEHDLFAFGFYLSALGDVDGDGIGDLAVTGALHRPMLNPASPSGRSYLIFGRREWPPRIDLPEAISEGQALFWPNEACGSFPVAGPGDLDGDGMPDLATGNGNCVGSQGRINFYTRGLVPGAESPVPPMGWILGDPTPFPDPLDGRLAPRAYGRWLRSAEDLNGDGHPDLLCGVAGVIGEVVLLLGSSSGFSGETSIPQLLEDGRAVRIRKEINQGRMGPCASAGDFNGDGYSDLLVGLPGGGRDYHGETYLVFGSAHLGTQVRDIDLLEAQEGWLHFPGVHPRDWSGESLAGLGDLDGDGYSEVGIVSSDLRDEAGEAYVILGGAESPREFRLDWLGRRGFRIQGEDARSWFSAGPEGGIAAGDLDGDGVRDIALGERTAEGRRVVVLFGRRWCRRVPAGRCERRSDAADNGRGLHSPLALSRRRGAPVR